MILVPFFHQVDLYFGYFSFESGVIVKILGLDDSILKDFTIIIMKKMTLN
ncbi:PoNe immunity protein domain-containing protein [Bacillus cereus]